jgi:peptidylprolyl isomerase
MNMKKLRNLLLAGSVAVAAIVGGAVTLNKSRSSSKNIKEMTKQNKPGDVLVEIKTTEGDLTVRLFGDTPRHRDNFVKLAKEGYYNGVLFHRVINEFMVQTGDPDSKTAPAGKMLGSGGPGYDIEAEIVYPTHFHKRGALAAARQGDQVNPERRSSGSQFYIVTGKAYNDSTLNQMERQLQMMQKQNIFNDLAREHRDSIMTLRRNRDQAGLQALQDELVAITEKKAAEAPARLTAEQREAYTTTGGTPHLDNQYTVFGEVVDGMDVIDKIEKVETDSHDRPLKDVKILSMRVLTD